MHRLKNDYVLGPYRLLSKLGSGSQGQIWHAEESSTRKHVALKIVPLAKKGGHDDPGSALYNELAVMEQLSSPHIAEACSLSFGTHNSVCYFAMELFGTTLASQIAKWRDESHYQDELRAESVAVHLARQIQQALFEVHAKDYAHGDVSPSNVGFVRGSVDQVKLFDFGLSFKLPMSRLMMAAQSKDPKQQRESGSGTPLYMSRRVMNGNPPFAADDLESLTFLFLETACGCLEWQHFDHDEAILKAKQKVIEHVLRTRPFSPSTMKWLKTIWELSLDDDIPTTTLQSCLDVGQSSVTMQGDDDSEEVKKRQCASSSSMSKRLRVEGSDGILLTLFSQ